MLSNRYKRKLENWRVSRVQPLDTVGIVALTQSRGRVKGNERSFLPKRNIYIAIMVFITILLFQSNGHTYASVTTTAQQDNYKLYAHNRILSSEQYECFNNLINSESHWNPHVATNHGNYGMVQGHDKAIHTMDAYQQIDWAVDYIHARYGSMCKAWLHEQRKHWY